jgi:hypothetical protein
VILFKAIPRVNASSWLFLGILGDCVVCVGERKYFGMNWILFHTHLEF